MPWVEPITRRAAWVVIAGATITFLALARDFVLPLALAILLAFMLSPIVRWLHRRIKSRIASVTIACLLGSIVVAGISTAATLQFLDFAEKLPLYRHTISKKIIAMKGSSDGVISRAIQTMAAIEEDVETAATPATTAPSVSPPPMKMPAIPVVTRSESTLFESTTRFVEPVVEPLLVTSIVAVLVFLLLYYGEELRDRIVVMAGTHQLSVTSQALQDASKRIGKYLLMQACVNTFFGVSIGIGLMLIGIPNALFLGILAGLFRFVPILGAWLGAAIPLLLSLAVFDAWTPMLYVVVLFAAMEAFVNFVVEPYLYGHSTGITGIAVVVAILFWTWIWGPIGLLLAVPLTVCLVVLGKYIEPLRVFYIMLSDEPMLSGETRLYHRLVSGDIPAAESMVEAAVKDIGIAQAADTLLLPALELSRIDFSRGSITDERFALVNEAMQEMVEDYALVANVESTKSVHDIAFVPAAASDKSAATISAAATSRHLDAAMTLLESSINSEVIQSIRTRGIVILVLVCVSPESAARARLLAKSLHRSVAETRMILFDPSNLMSEQQTNDPKMLRISSIQKLIETLRPAVLNRTEATATPHTPEQAVMGAA